MKKYIFFLIGTIMLLLTYCSSENGDWQNAKTENTTQALSIFLEKYPESIYTDSASTILEKLILKNGIKIDIASGSDKEIEFKIINPLLTYHKQMVFAGIDLGKGMGSGKLSFLFDSIAPKSDCIFGLFKLIIKNSANDIQDVALDNVSIKTKSGVLIDKMVLINYEGILNKNDSLHAYCGGVSTGQIKPKETKEWDILLLHIPKLLSNDLVLSYKKK